ncbi:MAG: GDP-mannose 4,6-dehydratase [Thermoprotei archaeon]|nr:GDP-mannose 4,6-dehydratase [Thermoprotei archaeon]
MKVIVTGGAGFLGSFLCEALLDAGFSVIVIDNFSSGSLSNLARLLDSPHLEVVGSDLREPGSWVEAFKGSYAVFHFAANPEVRHSLRGPLDHYHQNVTATANVLEASRISGVKIFVFASSSTVYGDATIMPTPEDHPLKPISVYGATKAMGEVLCETYARLYNMKCLILRYANIVGPRLRHGAIYDFLVKLSRNPQTLEILGDGSQRKSYLHISDSIEATIAAFNRIEGIGEQTITYNVGNTDWITVREIADIVVETLGLEKVEYIFKPGTPDGRGWPGDVKLMLLSIDKIVRDTGWKPKLSSREAVKLTAESLAKELRLTPRTPT